MKELFLRTLDALSKAGIEKVFQGAKLSVLPIKIQMGFMIWHAEEYRALAKVIHHSLLCGLNRLNAGQVNLKSAGRVWGQTTRKSQEEIGNAQNLYLQWI